MSSGEGWACGSGLRGHVLARLSRGTPPGVTLPEDLPEHSAQLEASATRPLTAGSSQPEMRRVNKSDRRGRGTDETRAGAARPGPWGTTEQGAPAQSSYLCETVVGGSCLWSPARMHLLALSRGIQQLASRAWAHSSMTARSK